MFERVADGIAYEGGLGSRAPFPAEVARFDELLCVVPRTATGIQDERHEDARDGPDHQHATKRLRPEQAGRDPHESEEEADGDRWRNREQPADDRLLKRAASHDVEDRKSVV